MPANQLPTVLFLDLDKTVIGRAHAAVERHFLRKVIDEVADAGELSCGRPMPLAPEEEMAPLLRPGFADAIRRLRATLPNLEVFVCTMGVHKNVMELKVPGIERATGLRFNRPVFCRDDCQSAAKEDLKLVGACFHRAIDALSKRKKYAFLKRDPAMAVRVFDERFFMIDDTPRVAFDEASNARLITCPLTSTAPHQTLSGECPLPCCVPQR
jgi:hypothetical protein